jgi:hypothetical protein
MNGCRELMDSLGNIDFINNKRFAKDLGGYKKVKEKRKATQPDLINDGKDKAFLDIDRMINEGLSGGTVHMRDGTTNIEEARELEKEEPPHRIND